MGQGALSKPVVQWWLSLNSSRFFRPGKRLSSATAVHLQAPPQTALPKPEHRPNCRCPVKPIGLLLEVSLLAGMGGMGTHASNGRDGHRMLLSVTLGFGPITTHTQNDFFALFLFPFTTFHNHLL